MSNKKWRTQSITQVMEELHNTSPTTHKRTASDSFSETADIPKKLPFVVCKTMSLPDTGVEIRLRNSKLKKLSPKKSVSKCLDYLTRNEAYKTEGIFRQCGDFDKISSAKAAITNGTASSGIFDDLGIYGVADLLKILLQQVLDPLIDEKRFLKLAEVPDIIKDTKMHAKFSSTKLASLSIASVFASLPHSEFRLLIKTIEFLHLVIKHEEQTRMGLRNISSVFCGILFAQPTTENPIEFAKQTKSQGQLLELIFTCMLRFPDMLHQMYQDEEAETLRILQTALNL